MIRCTHFAAAVSILVFAIGCTSKDEPITGLENVGGNAVIASWDVPGSPGLEFDRNRTGAITGFGLSSGSEQGIIFERR